MRVSLSIVALLLVANCGHKTSLIAPADIPAYEQKRREKLEKYAPYDKNKAPKETIRTISDTPSTTSSTMDTK